MNCFKCNEKIGDPMNATCDRCGADLAHIDVKFVEKFQGWLDECVNAGEVDGMKAAMLLNLASKPMRAVTTVDFWPKMPTNEAIDLWPKVPPNSLGVPATTDGLAVKLPDSEVCICVMNGALTMFSWREGMDDPYVRITFRHDVPLAQLSVIEEQMMDVLSGKLQERTRAEVDELSAPVSIPFGLATGARGITYDEANEASTLKPGEGEVISSPEPYGE